ncbi:MAG: hypothetical protein M0R80_00105 [Proteobacteria bacterium]|jgi:hypothetical protein|nr:hypothetical protein [Pseudomonadota bacterium]
MTPEEQEALVQELESSLDRLQALYNQYFMGIERLEPTIPHKEVVRKMQLLRREKMYNTALRFRFQTQVQKYSTQSTYWKRICRQIEEGTYQRDLNRAQKRTDRRDEVALARKALRSLEPTEAAPSEPTGAGLDLDDPFSEAPKPTSKPAAAIAEELDDPFSDAPPKPSSRPAAVAAAAQDDPDKTPVPILGSGLHPLNEQILRSARRDADDDEEEDEGDLSSFFQKRPSLPPPPARPKAAAPAPPRAATPAPPRAAPQAAKPAPAPSAGATLSEERMKAIYRAYVTARKKTNEPTDNLTYAKIATLLKKQSAEKAGVTDFKVVIRNGKAIIKTVKET